MLNVTRKLQWKAEAQMRNAIWTYKGAGPHAFLAGAKHSSGEFLNAKVLCRHPTFLINMCRDIVAGLEKVGLDLREIDYVVGPAMGAIEFAFSLAWVIEQTRGNGRPCRSAFTNKQRNGTFRFVESHIEEGSHCLVGDDVISSGDSLLATRDTILSVGGTVAPHAASIGNRSGTNMIGDMELSWLIDLDANDLTPEECIQHGPCVHGSKILKPDDSNWREFEKHIPRYR